MKVRYLSMRKENLITRTIVSTVYTVMAVDINTATVENIDVTLSGATIQDTEKVLKKVSGLDALKGRKAVAVVSSTEVTNLYGMSDVEFMKYARIIKEGGR